MQGKQAKKVTGGKLVQVEVDFEDTINRVLISGDFFAHPEDGVHELEKSFIGLPINSDLLAHIKQQTKDLMLVGVDAQSIAELLREAILCGE